MNTTAPAERSVGAESVDPPVEAVERTHETGLQLRIGTLHAAALPDGAQMLGYRPADMFIRNSLSGYLRGNIDWGEQDLQL